MDRLFLTSAALNHHTTAPYFLADPTILVGYELNATDFPRHVVDVFFALEDLSAEVSIEVLSSSSSQNLEITTESGRSVANTFVRSRTREQLMNK